LLSPQNQLYIEEYGESLMMPFIERCGFQDINIGTSLGWHKHGYEFTYIVKGNTTWEIEGGKSLTIDPQTGALTIPYVVHRSTHGVTRPSQHFWLILDTECKNPGPYSPFSPAEWTHIIDNLHSLQDSLFKVSPYLYQTLCQFRDLVLYTKKDSSFYYASWRTYLSLILIESFKVVFSTDTDDTIDIINILKNYVYENLSSEITIYDFSSLVNKSQSYVYNLFKDKLGQSPNEYIRSIRIEKTIELLENTDNSITSIAFDCGFSSSQYFSKMFYRYIGCSPSEYRKVNVKKKNS